MQLSKIYKFINYNLLLYSIFLVVVLLPYYKNGFFILGGEGNYFLDFQQVFLKYSYAWQDIGMMPAFSLNSPFFYSLALIPVQKLLGIQIANFILVFSLYFLPYLSMHLVCKQLNLSRFSGFIISLFYVINPFSIYYIYCLNQWSIAPLTVIPLFFWVQHRYYYHKFKLFLYIGIISLLFAYANTNPPLMAIIQFSIIISTFVSVYHHNKRFSFLEFIQRYLIAISSFAIFNLWWIFNWFAVLKYSREVYTMDFALYWLDIVTGNIRAITFKALALSHLIPKDPSYNFFSAFYNMAISNFVILIPISLVSIYLFILDIKAKTYIKKMMFYLFFGWLFLVILIKGNSYPFGFVYELMYNRLPFFYIFKTPTEKFGVLYVFVFSLLLIFLIKSLNRDKLRTIFFGFFIFYLCYCSIPIIMGNIIPDYSLQQFGIDGYASRKYIDKNEYKAFRGIINNGPIDYKILSLPGSRNYQVALYNHDNNYYTGMDPLLYSVNKPFFYAENGPHILFDNISHENYTQLLKLYNVKKILINEDSYPWFKFREKESIVELKETFGKDMPSRQWGPINLYDNVDDFLPHIYIPATPVIVNGDADGIVSLLSTKYLDCKPALFFNTQEENQALENEENIPRLIYDNAKWKLCKPAGRIGSKKSKAENKGPEIIFKKVNPVKYHIKIENAKDSFWLVFNESFHEKWKLYLADSSWLIAHDQFEEIVADYPKLGVKEARHQMKFAPQDIRFLLEKPLDAPHYLVNGYANSWYVEPEKLGLGEEFVLTIYFWPQSLFYLGLMISGATLLGCIGYLAWPKKRKKRLELTHER
jgi:hypothetical protein